MTPIVGFFVQLMDLTDTLSQENYQIMASFLLVICSYLLLFLVTLVIGNKRSEACVKENPTLATKQELDSSSKYLLMVWPVHNSPFSLRSPGCLEGCKMVDRGQAKKQRGHVLNI